MRLLFGSLLFLLGCPATVVIKDADTGETFDCADGAGNDCDGDGYTTDEGDCDDLSSAVHPGAEEDCADGTDGDCDGFDDGVDPDCNPIDVGDDDGDGYATDEGDCDDANASVNPGAAETCNGTDDDCDGITDENASDMSAWYADLDGDGYGDASSTVDACDRPDGYVADGGDCDDAEAATNPGAAETCNDRDDDCDGAVDDGAVGAPNWYPDVDGDGYGDASYPETGCDQPTGYVADGGDCDDADAVVHPDAAEVCGDGVDNNCDPSDDASGSAWYADLDGDGYGDASTATTSCDRPDGYVADGDDCDDASASVNPGAAEACNGTDDDCDSSVDEDFDLDADAYLDAGACEFGDDCDDADAAIYPGSPEDCDGVDNDCDGTADEDFDLDLDGYVDAASCGDDCDDADADVHPDAAEVCGDGTDNNCDPSDDASGSAWYADVDGDGYGDATSSVTSCTAPVGYVTKTGDCDDTEATTYIGATETCNLVDDDCDGTADDAAVDADPWYPDADGDGYGAWVGTVYACSRPVGYESDNSDCDDADAALNNADADADGDTTCDGDCDDADAALNLDDGDGDGYSTCDGECDDHERTWHPGASEACDGEDNDCDGVVDDGLATYTWFFDADRDGYGDPGIPMTDCAMPPGSVVTNADDCDDADAATNPGAAEECNLLDDDCDGTVDDGFDADGDGAYDADACSYGDDCDDADASIYAGATDACDGVDNNCDGLVDEDADGDGDGFASATTCLYGDDCDDADASTYPRAHELGVGEDANCADGADNDCDGTADASDWDCQNDDGDQFDSDGDGSDDSPIYNGVDAVYAIDDDADGSDDTICVVAELAVDESYASDDGVRQGNPSATWGGFSAVYAANTDLLGAVEPGAWCFDFGHSGLTPTRYRYRYVADSTATSSSCADWEVSDLSQFCDFYRDPWCSEYGTGAPPCGYDWVVGVKLNSDGSLSQD